jgi:hypothetical protein
LKANVTSLGLKEAEIVILPEAKVPADSGQKTLTIHPDKKMGVTMAGYLWVGTSLNVNGASKLNGAVDVGGAATPAA